MSVRIRPGDEPVWADDDVTGTGWTGAPGTDDSVPDPHDVRDLFDEAPLRPEPRLTWRPEWTRFVAGGLLAIIVVGVLGLLAFRLSMPAPVPTSQPASAAPPSPTTSAPPSAADPTPAPRDVMAMPWQGAALPVSDAHGPEQFTDRRSTGFSRDPQGAALAAVHISTHIDPYTGPRVFTPTITEQVIGGEDLVERTEQQYRQAAKTAGLAAEAVERGDPVLAPTGEMTGWRIRDFRPQSVTTVELLVTTPQGQQVVYEVPVVWSDDDWRVSLSDSLSDALFRVTSAHDPDTFEPFINNGE